MIGLRSLVFDSVRGQLSVVRCLSFVNLYKPLTTHVGPRTTDY